MSRYDQQSHSQYPGARSPRASVSSLSALRPSGFLNMLNPLGRNYQGYMRANQSVLEEDDYEEEQETEVESAYGASSRRQSRSVLTRGAHGTSGGRRVSWGESSRMNTLNRSNERGQDQGRLDEESDDEIPHSFMVEAQRDQGPSSSATPTRSSKGKNVDRSRQGSSKRPVLPLTTEDAIPLKMPPKPSDLDSGPLREPQTEERKLLRGLDAYERALWNWINVYDLDVFLQDVYRYYEGKGIYCIALSRGLHLLTVGFVIFFSTFLLNCIDYSRIRPEGVTSLSEVIVPRCVSRMSGLTLMPFLFFGAFYVMQLITYVLEVMRLVDMYRFYTHLLRIPDADIQTISWPEIVRRIEAIREENPVTALSSTSTGNPSSSMTAKLDAHDIANRIMREENYLIALFNKDLLDLRIPLPHALSSALGLDESHGLTLSTTLEHNLRICLMRFLFDSRGRVREAFLRDKKRNILIKELKNRFIFMGILNAILAPFIVLYLLMYYFFRYFEEYHKNPSSIGGRSYTLYARWKFREFNELPHLFSRRLDESYPTASMYIGQFPNEKMALLMRFVSFVAGSFAAVLILASIIDPDIFLHFEITHGRSVVFYIGLFASVLAVARGMVPEDNFVFYPEELMMDVIQFTHYMPNEWKGQLHSQKVHKEFGKLFDMKIMIFMRELLSVILTPFVLWFSLPNCAPAVVDFFREFTIHVDSLGYVCSFAVFDFRRHGNIHFGAPTEVRDERLMSKEGKMEKSFLNFKAAHPEWQPTDPSGSLYLNRMANMNPRSPRHFRHLRSTPSATAAMMERRLEERANEYDRALRQSQTAAVVRRVNVKKPASGAVETLQAVPSPVVKVSPSTSNPTAQAAAMEESNVNPFPHANNDILAEDVEQSGDVRSELGESYVDGKVARGQPSQPSATSIQREDSATSVEDGGMLNLLTQIYGTKGGPGHRRVL